LLFTSLELEVGLADVVLGVVGTIVDVSSCSAADAVVNIVVGGLEVEDGNDPHCQLNADVH
jgi:hypothetical protein